MGRALRVKIAAVVGFAALGVLVAMIDEWRLRRDEHARRAPLGHPPSDHRPIDVGRLVLTRGLGDRSGLGAALLMMAHEGTIDLDGLDSRRYVLRIPAGARGPTPTDNEILDGLREGSPPGTDVELLGPPLPRLDWGARDPGSWRT